MYVMLLASVVVWRGDVHDVPNSVGFCVASLTGILDGSIQPLMIALRDEVMFTLLPCHVEGRTKDDGCQEVM